MAGKVERHRLARALIVALVQAVNGGPVGLDGRASPDVTLGRVSQGYVWIRDHDQAADNAAVPGRSPIGPPYQRPHVVDERPGLGVVTGRAARLEDHGRLEAILADNDTPEGWMVPDDGLDADRVELLARREDEDVVGAAVEPPVVGQRRMPLEETACRPLSPLGEVVEYGLVTCIGALAAHYEFVDVLVGVDAAPVGAHDVAIDDKVLPQLLSRLELEGIGHHPGRCLSAARPGPGARHRTLSMRYCC